MQLGLKYTRGLYCILLTYYRVIQFDLIIQKDKVSLAIIA